MQGRERRYRQEARIVLVGGLWLILSPWVLGVADRVNTGSTIVFGMVLVLFSVIRLIRPDRFEWISLLNSVWGIWLLIVPFTRGGNDDSTLFTVSRMIVGVSVLLASSRNVRDWRQANQ